MKNTLSLQERVRIASELMQHDANNIAGVLQMALFSESITKKRFCVDKKISCRRD